MLYADNRTCRVCTEAGCPEEDVRTDGFRTVFPVSYTHLDVYKRQVEDGKVAGYASLSRYRDRKAFDPAVEISIYVHKDYRGRGIGRSLMENVLAYAAECEAVSYTHLDVYKRQLVRSRQP